MDAGDSMKYNGENDHPDQRLENCPQCTQSRLSIPDLDIPPDKKTQEFAVEHDFAKVDGLPSAPRFDDEFEIGRHC
jgi:hypothetical protein